MRHGDHFAFCADITSYHLHTYPRWMVRPGGRRAYAETSRQHTTYSFLSLSLEIPESTGGVVVLLVTLKLALFSIDPARAPVSSYRQKAKPGISHLLSPPLSPPASTSANIIYPTRATPPRHCIFIRPRAEIPPPPPRASSSSGARAHAREKRRRRTEAARSLPPQPQPGGVRTNGGEAGRHHGRESPARIIIRPNPHQNPITACNGITQRVTAPRLLSPHITIIIISTPPPLFRSIGDTTPRPCK